MIKKSDKVHPLRRVTIGFLIIIELTFLSVFIQVKANEASLKPAQLSNTSLLSVALEEQSTKFVLYPNATCEIDELSSLSNDALKNAWQIINELENLKQHNSLVILEQIKFQYEQTKVVMQVDPNALTRVELEWSDGIQSINLVSIDNMYATYPEATALASFMGLIQVLRQAKPFCLINSTPN